MTLQDILRNYPMKFLRTIIILIEGILLFLIPVVLFYWFLLILDLNILQPIVYFLGKVFNPFLSVINLFVHFQINYKEKVIDLNPFLLAVVLLLITFVFYGIEKVLNFIEFIINKAIIRAKELKQIEQIELIKKDFLEALAKNKFTYIVLKFCKIETSSAYLYNSSDDFFSEGVLSSVLKGLVDSSEKFNGKKHTNFTGEDDTYNYIFYEITDGIDFIFNVHNRVMEINDKILDQSQRLYFTASFNCGYSEETSDKDILTANKILNLCDKDQILASELFRNKYEAVKEESNIKFISKGIYNINNDQIEIFELKVTPTLAEK